MLDELDCEHVLAVSCCNQRLDLKCPCVPIATLPYLCKRLGPTRQFARSPSIAEFDRDTRTKRINRQLDAACEIVLTANAQQGRLALIAHRACRLIVAAPQFKDCDEVRRQTLALSISKRLLRLQCLGQESTRTAKIADQQCEVTRNSTDHR